METKLARLKKLFEAGDHIGALRIAAKFPSLGAEKADITRAWGAIQNPTFYRQIGFNPEALVARGVAALRKKYKITTP